MASNIRLFFKLIKFDIKLISTNSIVVILSAAAGRPGFDS